MKKLIFFLLLGLSLQAQTLRNGSLVTSGSINFCTESGSASTYVCSNAKPIGGYHAGAQFQFVSTHVNGGSSTLNIDGKGAAAIVKSGSTALVGGEIPVGFVATVVYDGTKWQLQSTATGSGGGGAPTGAAGGSLAGTYPNPTIATVNASPGTFGSASTTPIMTVNAAGQVTSVVTANTATTPSGPAGGGLTGSYPNPGLLGVLSTPGTFGSATATPVLTLNAAGQVTAVSTATTNASLTGAAGGALAGNYPNPTLAAVNTTPGTFGNSSTVPVLTVNASGQVTAVSTAAVAGGGTATTTEYLATAYGAVPDGIMRTDGSMTAGSAVLNSVTGTFASGDVGKYIQVIGAGQGGTALTGCSIPNGSSTLTCTSATFVSTDVGRGIAVTGAGAGGAILMTFVNSVTSGTVITLTNPNSSGSSPSGVGAWIGAQTLEGTISSFQSATQVTLSASASATVGGAIYAYGTNNVTALQTALDTAGAAGGGVVRLTAPTTCPSGATCGYVAAIQGTQITGTHNPGSMKIRYNNISLRGPEGMQIPVFCRGAAGIYSNTVSDGTPASEIRGACIVVGDQDGPRSTNGLITKNTTIYGLALYGMTNGLTYRGDFVPSGAPLTTTLDGWDESHKGILIPGSDQSDNLLIENVSVFNTKGENIWSGGGFQRMTIRNCTLDGSNADGISVSATNLVVLNNVIKHHFNGAIEQGTMSTATGGATFDTIRHIYQNNLIQDSPGEAIVLTGVDAGVNSGSFLIDHNVFERIGTFHGTAAQTAIFLTIQAGGSNLAPANVIVTNNVCHDCMSFITPQVSAHLEFKNNTAIADQFSLNSVFNLMQPLAYADISNNYAYQTASAISGSRSFGSIYAMNIGFVSGNFNWSHVFSHDNFWTVIAPNWNYTVSTGGGLSLVTGNYISFARDVCQGCTYPNGDYGRQDLTTNHTVEPIGPVVWVSATSTQTITINKAKSESGAVVTLYNGGSVALNIANDANVALAFNTSAGPGSLAAGAIANFRYDSLVGKWISF